MSLDSATLMIAGGFVAVLSGAFLLAYWAQDRSAWAALWWAVANGGLGVGIILLALAPLLTSSFWVIAATRLFDVSAILTFVAARIFNRGSVDARIMAAFVCCCLALLISVDLLGRAPLADILGQGVSIGFYTAAALEFWRRRSQGLPGRTAIIGVLLFFTASRLLLALDSIFDSHFSFRAAPGQFRAIDLIVPVYVLGVTVFLVMMLTGRKEEKYRNAALVDPLTGLGNRAAFMDRAQRAFDRGGKDGSAVALLAFDLDRFKTINDTFGHAAGDQILRVFGAVLSSTLRSSSIIARIGGEEFVAVVPGAGAEAAVAMGRRICEAFQSAGQFLDGQKIEATVSVGVATNGGRLCAVADVLAAADGALYRAKAAGRNRVVLAGEEPNGSPPDNVVRIA